MLVLSRRRFESLLFVDSSGREIVVTVVRINGNHVALGIDAPADMEVMRAEAMPPREEQGV